jgi:transcriptional regulator GlxA family with amidase domain
VRVAIAVYDGVDLLDVGGPYEVFLTANRLAERAGQSPPFEVITAGAPEARAYGGLGLQPQAELGDLGPVDVLVIPGAVDLTPVRQDSSVIQGLAAAAQQADLVASVCTGAFLLADMGLLPEAWTTHWQDVDALQEAASGRGDATVRWVDAGRVVTSGGLSSGIAMALHLVDRLCGRDLAVRTARQIDYEWDPAGSRQVSE